MKSLAALVVNQLNPRDGPLLHVSAKVTAGDLAGRLNKAGFGVEKSVLYETIPSTKLSTRTEEMFKNNEMDIVILFSPRTARTFVALLKRSELLDFCKGLVVVCLSKDVAAELYDITGISILTANEPTLEAMLRIFRDIDCGNWENG